MEALLSLAIPVLFVLLLILERIFPARKLPKVRFWLLKGVVFFVLTGTVMGALPALLSIAIGSRAPLNLTLLGPWVGGLVGFLASDIVSYGVHRLLHNVPFLWRWTHQMHHSAERLDVAGANYFHPFEMLVQGTATTIPILMLGLTPTAAAFAGTLGFLAATFQHMNIRTPQWVGYIVQRPEAHSVHHARGVHAYNYGSFMLWDIVFGTFRNPVTFTEPQGFWDGASSNVGAMLIGRDVGEPPKHVVHLSASAPASSSSPLACS